MSGWRSDDATPPPVDPERPRRPRRADHRYDEQFPGPEPDPQDPYVEDPYAAQREAEYVAQHEDQRHGQDEGPPEAWWNLPPEESARANHSYAHDQPYDQLYDESRNQEYDDRPGQEPYQAQAQPSAPAEPTRPMRQDSPRRSRRQAVAPDEPTVRAWPIAPDEPTVRARPNRPEQARYSDERTPAPSAPGSGQGGQGRQGDYGGYGSGPHDEGRPYDQTRDREPGPDEPYFHPLDPETPHPKPSSRRGWRAPPPETPASSPYDLSGLDPAELTGSLSLLGLEGPAVQTDFTQPIEPIRAPIARAPRRPQAPVPPRRPRGPQRGYPEPELQPEVEAPLEPEQVESAEEKRTSSLLGSSALMAAGTAVSRVLGFVRASVLLAAVQPGGGGVSTSDAFSVANVMPNALYILLAGGVLNAVLVPQIAKAARQKDGGEDYINRLLTAALGMLAGLTVVVILAAPLLVKVYDSPKWDPDLVALATAFSLWCLPQVFFYGLYTLIGQVLNARGRFGAYMWAPVVNNVVSIVGLVIFVTMYHRGTQPVDTWDSTKIMLLAGSQTLGVAAQALILIPVLSRAGIRFRPKFGLRGVGLSSASRVAGWTFAAVIVQQVAFIVISKVTTTATQLLRDRPDAKIQTGKTIYDNAQLLFVLPHSLIAVSLVTALFTRMANAASQNRIRDVRADLSLGLRLTGLATVVSTAAVLALGPEITASMFPGSNRGTTNGVAYVVMAMALGMVPYSAQYLFARVFYAFEDAKTPFFIQIASSGTWATGNLISLLILKDKAPEFIVVGVGLSMAASNFVGAFLSYSILRRRFGDLDGHQVVRAYLEMFVVAAIGGVVAWLLAQSVQAFFHNTWLACILATVIGGLALLAIYVAGLRQLGVSEVEDVLGPLLRRLPSSPPQTARHSTR